MSLELKYEVKDGNDYIKIKPEGKYMYMLFYYM